MKFKLSKIIIFFIIILGSFFVIKYTLAASPYQLTNTQNYQSSYTGVLMQLMATSTRTNFQGASLYFDPYDTNEGYPSFSIKQCVNKPVSNSSIYSSCSTVLTAWETSLMSGHDSAQYLFLSTSTPVTINTDYYYVLMQYLADSPGQTVNSYYTIADNELYAHGSGEDDANISQPDICYANFFGSGGITCNDVKYLYFRMWSSSDYLTTNDNVNRIYPPGFTWHMNNDFNFIGTYTNSSGYDFLRIDVVQYVGNDYEPTFIDSLSTSITSGQNISWSIPANYPDGNYAWVAYLFDSSTQEKHEDQVVVYWNFSIGSSTPIIIQTNSSSTEPVGGGKYVMSNCNQKYDGTNFIFQTINALQKALCWLFIPQETSFQLLASSTNQIIYKAPIGYVKLAADSISAIATSSLATTTPAFITNSNYYWVKQLSYLGIFSLFKLIITTFLGILAFVYIIKRIKSLIKI
jgi:hypothetical protein